MGQLFEPVRGVALDLLKDLARLEALHYPAFEKGVGGGPKVEVGVELATESLDIE